MTATAAVLADPAAELEEFDGRLREELPPHLYDAVARWVNEACPAASAPLWNAVGQRCEKLGALAEQAEGKESAEEGQARIQQYFQTVNPGPIAQDLQRSAKLHSFTTHYHRAVRTLADDPVVGPVVRRYLVPDEVLRGLAAACAAPLQSCMDALGCHANQMKAHADLLRSLQESKGLKTGVGVAATIAGGLLLGPLGAVAARALTGAAMDPSERINESAERVGSTFEQFRAHFVAAMEQVDTNVLAVYLSLYGGLLLRVQEDLAVLGRSLAWLDFGTGGAVAGLSELEHGRFVEWASSSLTRMEDLARSRDWLALGDAADKALRLTLADSMQVNIVDEDEVAFVVRFARHRATALNAVADVAWQSCKYADASRLYRHLLEETNVAWECDLGPGEPTPSWNPAIAGWRLALAATAEPPVAGAEEAVLVLPDYVAQALFRFNSERPFDSAPGEMLSGLSAMVAATLVRFSEQMLGAPVTTQRVPSHLRSVPPEQFSEFAEGPVDFGALGDLIPDEWSAGMDGSFLRWFRAGVESAERTATWLGCGAIGCGLLVLVVVIWLVVKLFT
jgi:hypothetical protein